MANEVLAFLQQEKQELGERVMVTRLHLFNKWVKVCHSMWIPVGIITEI